VRVKVLFALPGFHCYDRGAEVALLAVATELARSGNQVTVAGAGQPRSGELYDYCQVPAVARERWERFPKVPPFRSETAWEDATFAAGLLVRPLGRFDATITCSFPFTHWALRAKARGKSAHVFVTQNGDWPAFSNDAEYRTFRCDGLVCTNPDYFERNRERWPSALIPNGIDLDRFTPGPPGRSFPELSTGAPIILMVSALIETKRVIDGIRAAATFDNATLVVAGDGPLRQEVLKAAQELLPGRFKLVSLGSAQMPDLYRSADVFMHLSLQESFGNVFLEAWACGLPIVAHDSERLRWILGDSQFLCATTNPADLRAALEGALSSGSKRARKGIERFSWSAVGQQYHDFLVSRIASSR
jgi:glycosyltransferase involved in cell wall biosynthesis